MMLLSLNATAAWTPAASRSRSPRGPLEQDADDVCASPIWLQVLDEMDYGVLLLDARGQVLHANHAARAELDAHHPLQVTGRELQARLDKDKAPLLEALQHAAWRGLRRLLTLGEGGQRVCLSVVPLRAAVASAQPHDTVATTVLLLGRRQVGGALSVQGFARAYRLSPSEEQVLRGLCEGDSPLEIAERHGVKIATVRTQITNMRTKTGASSIRDLVQQVAQLPPLVGALRAEPASGRGWPGGRHPLAA